MTDQQHDTRQDPADIERDIRRTQEDMSRTVDRIGNQLSIRNIFNALLDKADDNDVDARMLLDGARRNPMALGLIAAGAIWLVSDKDSKFPSIGSGKPQASNGEFDHDVHHRDYVRHMNSVEMRDGEDPSAYQRRRDAARANFLMLERGPDEDDRGFRQRLDRMTDSFREKRRAWMDASGDAAEVTKKQAGIAVDRTQQLYSDNPLVGGILAAALGAALGSALPITRKEEETLGGVGEKVRDIAIEQKDQLSSTLQETKDQVVEKATDTLRRGDPAQPQSQSGGWPAKPELSRT